MLTVPTAAVAVILAFVAAHSACAQDVSAKARLCDACHGETGIPSDPMMPVIWGQHQAYLVRQIGEFKVGNRANEPMLALIKEIPEPDHDACGAFRAEALAQAQSAARLGSRNGARPPRG